MGILLLDTAVALLQQSLRVRRETEEDPRATSSLLADAFLCEDVHGPFRSYSGDSCYLVDRKQCGGNFYWGFCILIFSREVFLTAAVFYTHILPRYFFMPLSLNAFSVGGIFTWQPHEELTSRSWLSSY